MKVRPVLVVALLLLCGSVRADTITAQDPTNISIRFFSTVHVDTDSVTPSEVTFNWTFLAHEILDDGRAVCGTSDTPWCYPFSFFTTAATFTSSGRFERGGSTLNEGNGPLFDFLSPALLKAITFQGTPQPNCFVDTDDPLCNPNKYRAYDVTLTVNNFGRPHTMFSASEKFTGQLPCFGFIACAENVVPGFGPLFPESESETPEPSSLALIGTGILGIGVAFRRQRRVLA